MPKPSKGGKRSRSAEAPKTTADSIQERNNEMMRMMREQGQSKAMKSKEFKEMQKKNADDFANMTGRKTSKFPKKDEAPKPAAKKPAPKKPKTGKAVQSDFTSYINSQLNIDLNKVRTNEKKFDNRNGFNISAKALGINGMNALKRLAARGSKEFNFDIEDNGADRMFVRISRK